VSARRRREEERREDERRVERDVIGNSENGTKCCFAARTTHGMKASPEHY
jgi:hypothetical protein